MVAFKAVHATLGMLEDLGRDDDGGSGGGSWRCCCAMSLLSEASNISLSYVFATLWGAASARDDELAGMPDGPGVEFCAEELRTPVTEGAVKACGSCLPPQTAFASVGTAAEEEADAFADGGSEEAMGFGGEADFLDLLKDRLQRPLPRPAVSSASG